MNDYTLKGFCRDCGAPQFMDNQGKWWIDDKLLDENAGTCIEDCTPEPVLSATQMKIIAISKEFIDWIRTNNRTIRSDNLIEHYINGLSKFLEDDPFLVSDILRKAGQKEFIEEQSKKEIEYFTGEKKQ